MSIMVPRLLTSIARSVRNQQPEPAEVVEIHGSFASRKAFAENPEIPIRVQENMPASTVLRGPAYARRNLEQLGFEIMVIDNTT